MVVNLVVGAHDTSTGQISCTLLTLLEHPEMLASLRADPALVPLAVEETMRYVSTIGAIPRVAIEPVDFDDLHFEPGALLFLCTDTANHDPIGYAEPGRFLPTRFDAEEVHRLMTFGAGPHYCLGAAFARMVVQEAVTAASRLPAPLGLAEPAAELPWTTVLAPYPAGLVVQVGFQYRFQPSYAKVRSLIDAGAVGPIFRSALVATNWFRPQDYFEAAGWRKEWRHAGGGVLMSQAIHQLDALLWFTGLPARVTARASRARHDIEVEDDVMALLEFPNGGRGTIVASTVDPVGSDRIELHGEQCSLVMDEHELRVGTFDGPAQRLSDESTDHFDRVPVTWEDIAVPP